MANKPSISDKPRKSRYKQGKFTPNNPSKYQGTLPIVYRSSWELKYMKYLDMKSSVLFWASESLIIPYISPIDNLQHRYFVDFLVKMKLGDGSAATFAVEVKPLKETKPPRKSKNVMRFLQEKQTYEVNQAKWTAATEFCKKRNVQFIVLTEKELNIT